MNKPSLAQKPPHIPASRQNIKNPLGNFLALIWQVYMQNFSSLASKLKEELLTPIPFLFICFCSRAMKISTMLAKNEAV